jgi:purine-binding chemotaxis protein CheW
MSPPVDKQSILRERAHQLLARRNDMAGRELYERVVVVEVGRERFGLPLSRLREIVRATPISRLPDLPACMLGICAVRGELVSVVDLAELHGSGRVGSSPFLALMANARRTVGLTFNALLEMRDVFRDELITGLPEAELARACTRAVTRDGISLLDVDGLLSSELVLVGKHGGTQRGRTP